VVVVVVVSSLGGVGVGGAPATVAVPIEKI
jgi:hypothetical protein